MAATFLHHRIDGKDVFEEAKRGLERRREGFKDWQDGSSLNQERKDEEINRILTILKSFLSWFKQTNLLNKKTYSYI